MPTQISHDPFARVSLMRVTSEPISTSCDWCGNRRKSGKLFKYWTESDASSRAAMRRTQGLFCSVSCFRAFHS